MAVLIVCLDSTDDDDDDAGGNASRSASVDELDVTELSRSHNLPSHILHLRLSQCDVIGHLSQTAAAPSSVSVHSISTVLRGSQFGPFNCHVVDRPQTSSCDDCVAVSEECRLEARFPQISTRL